MRKAVLAVLFMTVTSVTACGEIESFQKQKPVLVTFETPASNAEPTGNLSFVGEGATREFRDAHPLINKQAPGEKSPPVDLGPYLALRGPKGDKCQVKFETVIMKNITDPKTKKMSNSSDFYTYKQDICQNPVIEIALDDAHRAPKLPPVVIPPLPSKVVT